MRTQAGGIRLGEQLIAQVKATREQEPIKALQQRVDGFVRASPFGWKARIVGVRRPQDGAKSRTPMGSSGRTLAGDLLWNP